MTTTTSSSKGRTGGFWAVVRQDLRRVRSLCVFYTLLSFVFFPVQYILQVLNPTYSLVEAAAYSLPRYNLYGPGEIYGAAAYALFFPLMIVMAILFAAQLVSYMQNKRAVDVFHALPVTRVQMMGAHFVSGMAALGLPLLANFLIVSAIKLMKFGPAGLDAVAFEYVGWMITLFLLFGLTAFAAVCLGTMFDTVVFSLALNGIVPLIYLLCILLFSIHLYGYVEDPLPLMWMHPLIPLFAHQASAGEYIMENLTVQQFCISRFGFWLAMGLVVMALTIWIYSRRRSETAESLQTSSPLKLVMKFAGTFVGAILFGFLFDGLFGDDMGAGSLYEKRYFIGGVILGAVLTYFIIEAVLARGFKTMKKALLPAGACTLAVGAFAIAICSGGAGYSTRVPALNSVASVTVNYLGAGFDASELTRVPHRDQDYYRWRHPETVDLETEEAKSILLAVHQAQVSEWQANADRYGRYGRSFTLEYKLQNGSVMRRRYNLSDTVCSLLVELETCDEFIEKTNPIAMAAPEQIDRVQLANPTGETVQTLTLTPAQKQQLQEALLADLKAQTSQDLLGQDKKPAAYLRITFSGLDASTDYQYASVQQSVGPSFQGTLALLDQWGLTDSLAVDMSHYMAIGGQFDTYWYSSEGVLELGGVAWDDPDKNLVYTSNYMYASDPTAYDYFTYDPQTLQALYESSSAYALRDEPYLVLSLLPKEEYARFYYSVEDYEWVMREDLPENAVILQPDDGMPWGGPPMSYGDTVMAEPVVPETTDPLQEEGGSYFIAPTATRFVPLSALPANVLEELRQNERIRSYLDELEPKPVQPITAAMLR